MKLKEINDLDEYKKLLLEEVKHFDEFCTENDILYFVFWGSLIGAIRHNGFIPWDDDFDVILFRKDYEKLLSLFNKKNSRYKLVSFDCDKNFTAPLPKIIDTTTLLIQNYGYKEKVKLGVYIDIFILDDLYDDYKTSIVTQRSFMKLTKKWDIANSIVFRSKKTFFKDLLRFFYYLPVHLKGYKYYLKKISNKAVRVGNANSKYIGNLAYTGSDAVFSREDFVPVRHTFENLDLLIPSGYERILTYLYGDWHQPPNSEKQRPHHSYTCYKIIE